MKLGNYTHPWLGTTGGTLTSDIAQREGLERNIRGVIVDTIVKNSPAHNAGINGSITNQFGEKSGGDIITAVDGKSIIKLEDLISYLETQKSVGDNITLTIYDTEVNDIIDKEATLRERPALEP